MKKLLSHHHRIIFYSLWLVLGLIQSRYTELMDDEAYYWVYSRFLDWGYFDHPPMIAIVIKAGYALFHNEFGVRLWVVTISTLTLFLIYSLLPRKDNLLFYTIACSACLLQIGGIIAVPDIPLAFFVALFFVTYRMFLNKMSLLNATLLGVVMALLLYTKYHGILVILFTFFSNPKLALKYQAYLAAFIGAVLFLPHLYWQYTHGFPSVQYHLIERNAPVYEFGFTLQYLFDQILLPGPLVGWLLIWAAFSYKAKDDLERALKFSMIGFYIFFFISTAKGRVEANWTVPVLIPLIILSHQFLLNKAKWNRFLLRILPLNLLLVFSVRIYMMLNIIPLALLTKDEFHSNRKWGDIIREKTGSLPVVFINSYQRASKYLFYAGVPSFSLNTPSYRRNNYNFWPIEDSLYGKKVGAISPDNYSYYKDSISTPRGTTGMLIVDSFFSFSKSKITILKKPEVSNGSVTACLLQISTPEYYLKEFQTERLRGKRVGLTVYNEEEIACNFSTSIQLSDITKQDQSFATSFRINLPKGEYSAGFTMPTSLVVDPSLNSKIFKLIVK